MRASEARLCSTEIVTVLGVGNERFSIRPVYDGESADNARAPSAR
jgi:hypothetical protein